MASTARSSTPVVAVAVALLVGAAFGVAVVLAVGRLTGGAPADPSSAAQDPAAGMGMGGLPPANVRVGEAREQAVQERLDVIGRLEELRRATVAAESEGKIIAMPIEEGQRVEAGKTVLARIDPVWASVAVEAADARVASAQATLEQSDRELQYLEELRATGAARPKEVDDARAKAKADRAALEAAVAERNEAHQRFERLDVLAPFDGHMVRKHVEVGQWVEPGGDIAEVVSSGEIDAVVDVPERWVNEIALGEVVEVTVEPLGRRFTGEVAAVIPTAVSSARTYPVKVRLRDEDGLLKPGMSVLAHLPIGREEARLTVPRDAVLFQGGKATVWAAMDPQAPHSTQTPPAAEEAGGAAAPPMPPMKVATPVQVEVLFGVGDRYAVRGPVHPGTPVVIEGGEQLIPTQPLIVMPDPTASNPEPVVSSQ